ncbi:MAG: hypothetical protein ACI8Y4_002802 [Candidatus Poriferisodalaceae bacterium]
MDLVRNYEHIVRKAQRSYASKLVLVPDSTRRVVRMAQKEHTNLGIGQLLIQVSEVDRVPTAIGLEESAGHQLPLEASSRHFERRVCRAESQNFLVGFKDVFDEVKERRRDTGRRRRRTVRRPQARCSRRSDAQAVRASRRSQLGLTRMTCRRPTSRSHRYRQHHVVTVEQELSEAIGCDRIRTTAVHDLVEVGFHVAAFATHRCILPHHSLKPRPCTFRVMRIATMCGSLGSTSGLPAYPCPMPMP